jgi:hypothetical protein
MSTWWFDTYNEYVKNFEKIIQLQQDYIRNLEHISHLYNEFIKNIERVNELYNKSIASFEKLGSVYEQQFQNMQRMNQKWLDLFSKPWEQYQSEKHKDWVHLLKLLLINSEACSTKKWFEQYSNSDDKGPIPIWTFFRAERKG